MAPVTGIEGEYRWYRRGISAARADGIDSRYTRYREGRLLRAVPFLWNAGTNQVQYSPLPALNNAVGFILRKVCFERYGFPVLVYTAFAQNCIRWQKGISIDEPILPSYDLTQGMRISSYGYDSTAYQLGLLAIDLYNIGQLEHRISRYDQLKTVLKSVFHNIYHFNDRH